MSRLTVDLDQLAALLPPRVVYITPGVTGAPAQARTVGGQAQGSLAGQPPTNGVLAGQPQGSLT